ncbi:tetratricopeptide repeat protein [Tundrisphaera sp. TA3]|uniref:tetratricopeptide repeat protein n=1 Tax=Tundrisphaera sp. TA3 TaxID=3435775 RepID=UPI003EBC395F
MRRRAVIAGGCLILALLPGCAGWRSRRDAGADSPAQEARRQELSQDATAAMDSGQYDRARPVLETLAAESPKSAELHFRLGKVKQLQGDLGSAEVSYLRALTFDPRYVGALIGLGQVSARLGRHPAALERFETAIEVDPNQPEAHFARGQSLEALGRTDDALAAYFRSLELDPGSAPAILRIATLQLGRGQPDQALVRLDQAVDLAPDDPEARHQRGLAHLALKHAGPAIADLSSAAARLPDRPDVLLHLAQALEADRKPSEALQAVERSLRLDPTSTIARDLSDRLRR